MRNHELQTQIDTLALCLVLLLALLAGGCATSDEHMRMAIAAQQNVKPTLKVTCPAGGCEVEYTDPRERGQIKLPTNGYDVLNTAINTGASVFQAAIVPAAFAITATRGFDALKGSGAVTTTTTNTATTHTNTATTLSGTGTLGSGAYSTSSTSTVDDHSQTATPTVITAPAPVIVTQPAPVIVRP